MATFSSWLMDQRSREDQVGWVARYWKDLPDKPRMSSPVSIEGHLRQRGLMDSQEGLAEAWDLVMTEYRQQRLVTAATDAGVTPEQMAASIDRHPSTGRYAAESAGGVVIAASGVPVTLELVSAKLDAVLAHLGIAVPDVTLPPLDWQAMWDAADHDAAAAGE